MATLQNWHFQSKAHVETPAAMWYQAPGDRQPCYPGGDSPADSCLALPRDEDLRGVISLMRAH